MRLLLDSCTFLWLIFDDPALSDTARALFRDPANEVYLSAVSSWEIALKFGLGKLPLPEAPERLVPTQRARHGIEALPLDEAAALGVHRLPPLHKDPFDRMLVAQAISRGMTLLTPDDAIAAYPAPVRW